MSGWFRVLFLFNSFGPLYAILGASLWVQGITLPAVLWLGTALGAVLVFGGIASRLTARQAQYEAVEIEAALDENVLSYLIAYLPPLLVDDFSKAEKAVPALLFYAVVAVLMLSSNTLYINPFFLLFGFRIFRGRLVRSQRCVVIITRLREIEPQERLALHEIETAHLFYACRQDHAADR